jgi:hypothetical protein
MESGRQREPESSLKFFGVFFHFLLFIFIYLFYIYIFLGGGGGEWGGMEVQQNLKLSKMSSDKELLNLSETCPWCEGVGDWLVAESPLY